MNGRLLLTLSLLQLAAIACQPAQHRATTVAADREALLQLHDQHIAAARAEDVEAFLATVADDVALIPPHDPGARGREAVRTWFQNFFGTFHIQELEFPSTELHVDQDWAVKHYTYDWTVAPDGGGDPISDRGNGLYVYRRQSDGSWRIVYDLWTSSEPLGGTN